MEFFYQHTSESYQLYSAQEALLEVSRGLHDEARVALRLNGYSAWYQQDNDRCKSRFDCRANSLQDDDDDILINQNCCSILHLWAKMPLRRFALDIYIYEKVCDSEVYTYVLLFRLNTVLPIPHSMPETEMLHKMSLWKKGLQLYVRPACQWNFWESFTALWGGDICAFLRK